MHCGHQQQILLHTMGILSLFIDKKSEMIAICEISMGYWSVANMVGGRLAPYVLDKCEDVLSFGCVQ